MGILNGMTQRLNNMSMRLEKQLANLERRIAALQAAGHEITVDAELANARSAVAAAKAMIGSVLESLSALPDSEKPREAALNAHPLVQGLRPKIREARVAFEVLQRAIRADVRASARAREAAKSPLPVPSPIVESPLPVASPTPSASPLSVYVP